MNNPKIGEFKNSSAPLFSQFVWKHCSIEFNLVGLNVARLLNGLEKYPFACK